MSLRQRRNMRGRALHEVDGEAHALGRVHDAGAAVQELRDQVPVGAADGDDGRGRDDHADGQGLVRHPGVGLVLQRHADDQEHDPVLHLDPGALVGIEGVREVVQGDAEENGYALHLLLGRVDQIDPAVEVQVVQGGELAVNGLVNGDHDAIPCGG